MTAPIKHNIEKRLLTVQEAADYCGLSQNGLRDWIRKGRLPSSIPGTSRWDKKAIDRKLDDLSNLTVAESPDNALDQWLKDRDEN